MSWQFCVQSFGLCLTLGSRIYSWISTLSFQVQGVKTRVLPIPIICSVLCRVWITLCSWNHVGASGYKDENPSCDLQLITVHGGLWVFPLTRGSGGETRFCAAWAGDHLPWWVGQGLQILPLRNANSGRACFCLTSREVAVMSSPFHFLQSRASYPAVRISCCLVVLKGRKTGEPYKMRTFAVSVLF